MQWISVASGLKESLKKLKKLKYILLTHGHFDHVWEVKFAKEKTGAEIVISKEDAGCLNDDPHNLCHHAGIEMNKCYADITVSDGDERSVLGQRHHVCPAQYPDRYGLQCLFRLQRHLRAHW